MNQLGAERNFGVFKEPRGFIKVIQIVMAICAFATTCDFVGTSSFSTKCNSTTTVEIHSIRFSYPFRLDSDSPLSNWPPCKTPKEAQFIFGNYASSSQFYVFIGVTNFLYCLGILVLYVLFDEAYRSNDRIPKIDLGVSAGYAFFWLLSSAVWAGDVNKLKEYTEPSRIMLEVKCTQENQCTAISDANFANLNVSLIFGFANVGLWASSLWFLWKETSWFSARNAGGPIDGQDPVMDQGAQQYPSQPFQSGSQYPGGQPFQDGSQYAGGQSFQGGQL